MAAANSLARVLAILDLFDEERLEWTPEALMAALGYSRPTLYRYLKTLRETGLLAALPQGGYTLGPRVVELDYLMRRSDALTRLAAPHLEALAARRPCAALLVRWYGDKLLCVDSRRSAEGPLSSYPRGRPMPLARGAISRAIMANLPRERLRPLVARCRDELRAVGLGETEAEILASLRRTRKEGVAVARGEVTPGVVGVAAPVFDAGRGPVAALCVTLPGAGLAEAEIGRVGEEVRSAAEELGARLSRRRREREARASANEETDAEAAMAGVEEESRTP